MPPEAPGSERARSRKGSGGGCRNRTKGREADRNPRRDTRLDSPPEHSKLGPDSLDRHRRLVRDELRRQTQHPIAETREPLVAPRIRQAALSVTRAINFNDQPKFLRDEVRYVAPGDGYLTPE